jgi:hypothetical protein
MASKDRQHEKKLREAEKAYNKWRKAFLAGKISKEELKENLRPFKYELHELNLVRLKEGDVPPEDKEGEKEEEEAPKVPSAPVSYPPWSKKSSLTMDEIEERVDLLSLESRPSETLQMLYEKRYGEELSPPTDPVVFNIEDEDYDEELPGRKFGELPSFEEGEVDSEDMEAEEERPGNRKERKPFWKGLRRKNKGRT